MQIVAVGIFVLVNRALLVKRAQNDGILWAFPGGKVHEYENPEDAVVREFFEETGIKTSVREFIGERTHPFSKKFIKYYRLDYVGGRIKTPNTTEILEIDFFDFATARKLLGNEIFSPIKKIIKSQK